VKRRLALVAMLAMGTAAADADWLVLKNGTRLETNGPWTVQGRQVRFKNRNGALRSLPLADVDLDASKQATGPDPGRTRTEALHEGQAVDLPSERPAPPPAEKTALEKFIQDPNAPRTSGTLSVSRSLLAELYEKDFGARTLRALAVEQSGEAAVRELEELFEKHHGDIFRECQKAGADVAAELQDVCSGAVLRAGLEVLAAPPDPPEPEPYVEEAAP
jgi:hypothetical protein